METNGPKQSRQACPDRTFQRLLFTTGNKLSCTGLGNLPIKVWLTTSFGQLQRGLVLFGFRANSKSTCLPDSTRLSPMHIEKQNSKFMLLKDQTTCFCSNSPGGLVPSAPQVFSFDPREEPIPTADCRPVAPSVQ